MRDAIQGLGSVPQHMGLAYDVWLELDKQTHEIPRDGREEWFRRLAEIHVSPDYAQAFELWRGSLEGAQTKPLTLASRLLVGHGNPSPLEVGLTVHRTWGVPLIPGSALKGLLSHYVDAVYGPSGPMSEDRSPVHPALSEDERRRARYQGSTWDDAGRVHHGPGEIHRALFGAPNAATDEALRALGAECGETQGALIFHDALYVPSASWPDCPYAWDVLTVHQKDYYSGKTQAPTDYDDPNPVHFLTVRPGSTFLVAISTIGDDSASGRWAEQAMEWLCDALAEWGVGAKTSAGYGRFARPPRVVHAPVRTVDGVTLHWNPGGGGVLEAKIGARLVGAARGDAAQVLVQSMGPDEARRLSRNRELGGVKVTVQDPDTRNATIVRVDLPSR